MTMSDLSSYHNICDLFDQLGLPSDDVSINTFIDSHYPLSDNIPLWEAPWWNNSQAVFIREALKDDANWEIAVDELNSRLRKHI
jgi:hypothetical protein